MFFLPEVREFFLTRCFFFFFFFGFLSSCSSCKRVRILRRRAAFLPNQVDGAVLAVDDGDPSGSSTVTSRTPGAGARPEGGASKKAISALLLGLRRAPRLAMALLCRTTCCNSQAREGWRCASWAICARSVFLGR